jgi:hypothetical protein
MILFLLGVTTILSLSNTMKDLLRILADFFLLVNKVIYLVLLGVG